MNHYLRSFQEKEHGTKVRVAAHENKNGKIDSQPRRCHSG